MTSAPTCSILDSLNGQISESLIAVINSLNSLVHVITKLESFPVTLSSIQLNIKFNNVTESQNLKTNLYLIRGCIRYLLPHLCLLLRGDKRWSQEGRNFVPLLEKGQVHLQSGGSHHSHPGG